MQRRQEQRLERREIGQALVLFQPANLRFAVANLDGKLQLGEPFAPAQIFQQIAKGGESIR